MARLVLAVALSAASCRSPSAARPPHATPATFRAAVSSSKGRPLVEKPNLAGASVEQLLEALKAPEDYTRRQARLVLREMDHAQVTAALEKWLAGLGRG